MRRGFTIAELAVTAALGILVAGAGLTVLCSTRSAENRTWLRADVVEEAVHAQLWIERDLAALQHAAGEPPAELLLDASGAASGFACLSWQAHSDRPLPVRWTFDAAGGVLERQVDGIRAGRFVLGAGSAVRFSIVDPGYAHGQLPAIGAFGNRIAFRITAGAQNVRDRRALTLVGAVPLRIKAARDTFPFWNAVAQVDVR